VDGSGKSTCARILADRLDAVLITTPSPEVRSFRDDLIRSYDGRQEAGQLFYLSTVFDASDRVRGILASGRSVVIDRYFLSTQAYAAFRGSQLCIDDTGDLLEPANVTVFLDTPLEVRRKRLTSRGTSAADRETISEAADQRLLDEHMCRAGLPVVGRFVRMDSGGATPEGIVQRIMESDRRLSSCTGCDSAV